MSVFPDLHHGQTLSRLPKYFVGHALQGEDQQLQVENDGEIQQ